MTKQKNLRGGLSTLVTSTEKFKDYVVGNPAVGGYYGSEGRTKLRDRIVEDALREAGLGSRGVAVWLTSTSARHMMDPVDRRMSAAKFRKRVRDCVKFAFIDVVVWEHPDHDGTLASTVQLTKKLVKVVATYEAWRNKP